MENYHISVVKKSLVRTIVLGNMPAKWMWTNLGVFFFLLILFSVEVNFFIAILLIPLGFLSHILLLKAFIFDPMLFSVYFRHIFQSDHIPATSRAHFIQNKF